MFDDLGTGFTVTPHAEWCRWPSITESLASVRAEALAGSPTGAPTPPTWSAPGSGTKNPNTKKIVLLEPDLVIANKEENRKLDVDRLRARGVPAWVTDIRTVPDAIHSSSAFSTTPCSGHGRTGSARHENCGAPSRSSP